MEHTNTRRFEIEETTYTMTIEDGHTCLRSSGRHWAICDADGSWYVFCEEHFRAHLGCLEPEEVAAKLAAFDKAHREMMGRFGISLG